MLFIFISNIFIQAVQCYLNNREKYCYAPVIKSGSFTNNGTNHEYSVSLDHVDAHKSIYSGVSGADVNVKDSVHSDGKNSLLYVQANAGASVGKGGMQANAGAASSISKHRVDDVDIHLGQGNAYAGASIGVTGASIGAGVELNAVSFEHENIQARFGLNVSTGASISTTDVNVAVAGVGFNAGLNGFGLSTPLGSIKLKFW
jgi:hypothetical protein